MTNKKSKCYLVESYNSDFEFEDGSTVIALKPFACYELDKAGIKYSILEDYYNEETEITQKGKDYFQDQLLWFEKFDNYLFEVFIEAKEKKPELATSYYWFLKHMIDSLIIRCKITDLFINNLRPGSITYISEPKEDISNSILETLEFKREQSVLPYIVPIFCRKYNIPFKHITVNKVNKDLGISYRIKTSLARNEYIKHLWWQIKSFNIRGIFFSVFKKTTQNLFFLKLTSYVMGIVKEAQANGYGVFYKQNNKIIKQFLIFCKTIGNGSIDSENRMDISSPEIVLTDKTEIIKWINEQCDIDVTDIISPRLHYFINNYCPRLLALINKYVKIYDGNHIRFVFTPHMIGAEEFAAVIATHYAKNTKSVCLEHGNQAFIFKAFSISEYLPYHIYMATNDEMEQYSKQCIAFHNYSTRVFQYPNRFDMLPKVKNLDKKTHNRFTRKTVVYLPTMYEFGNTSWIEPRIPATWYYNWQRALLDYFNTKSDINFIWKALPTSNETYDPVPNIIKDRKYKNIKYASGPFLKKWVKKADLVLLDYPSTALYEAAVSGLPVMSLYFAPFNVIREEALKLFGKSLQAFNNFEEGIEKISHYLNSDPHEFIVSIPRSEIPIMKILDSC